MRDVERRKEICIYQIIICLLFGLVCFLGGIIAGGSDSETLTTYQESTIEQESNEVHESSDGLIAGVSRVLYNMEPETSLDIDETTLTTVGASYEEKASVENLNDEEIMEVSENTVTYEDVSVEKDILVYDYSEDTNESTAIVNEIDAITANNEIDEKEITEEIEEDVTTEESIETYKGDLIEIEATAYHDSRTADGTKPYYGVLAGKREWLGKKCRLYNSEKELIGEFEFHDVGYGRPTGEGKTSFKSQAGKSIGSIEAGKSIDIYMDSNSEARNWGRRMIYIEWIDD